MVKLAGDQIRELRKAMLDTFTSYEEWATLVKDADRDIDKISLASNLTKRAQDVLVVANDEGWLAKLLRAAKDARPKRPDFQAVVAGLLVMVEGGGRPEPVAGVSEDTEAKVISPVIRPEPLHIAEPFPMDLMRVPAGPFLMGSDMMGSDMKKRDRDANDDELSQHAPHTVEVAEFYIGKYEVTNEQYAAFVKATGHTPPTIPEEWQAGQVLAGYERHPVRFVSWYDAMAFAEWLSAQTGRTFRLPTEAQWEKAARGTDGRIYPWGDVPGPLRANFANIAGHVTRVGSYSPSGDSPYGAADMIGNVYEWTTSLLVGYPYDSEDGRENLTSQDARVARGVSFHSKPENARCAYRRDFAGEHRNEGIGFRVVLHS